MNFLELSAEAIARRLTTKVFKKIHFVSVTGSTNDLAIQRAKEGGEEGEIFIADHQTAGRGRMGRTWESPKGKNLYLSFLLKPPLAPFQAPLITLVGGAAGHDALDPFLPSSLRPLLQIKWPNDLFLQGRKIGGILTEMETESGKIRWVVCGIGIDLNADPEDFSPEVGKIAGSTKMMTGHEVDRSAVAAKLIEAFEKRYLELRDHGAEAVIAFCDRQSFLKGQRVVAEGPDGRVRGVATSLDRNGYLLVRKDSGETVPIVAGDVNLDRG